MNNSYYYELHAHTSVVSKCAGIDPEKLVDRYIDLGYAGLCITDHFLNGNTNVPQSGCWKQRIAFFCSGYEKAAEAGKCKGLDVFFGLEYSYRGTDLLTFGIDPKTLACTPQVMSFSVSEYCDWVHAQGGTIIHAHPFREADYIEMIRLLPDKTDAVEVVNTARNDFENMRAREYAKRYDLPTIFGTDNHSERTTCFGAVESDERFSDIRHMMRAIIRGRTRNRTIRTEHV